MAFTYDYPRPAFTVDALLYDLTNEKILLIRRGKEPFVGKWALPGGFMDMDETPEQAVVRELEEETGLLMSEFKQLATFGALDRDPRHRTVSTVFYAMKDGLSKLELQAADDADEAAWFEMDNLPEMAFDHEEIIRVFTKKKL